MSKSNYRFPYYGNTGQEKAEANAAKMLFDGPATGLIYYGSSTKVIVAGSDVLMLQSSVEQDDVSGTYMTDPIGYKYVAYPAIMAGPVRVIDTATGFDVAESVEDRVRVNVSVEGVDVAYDIYRTQWKMQSAVEMKFTIKA